MEKINKFYVRRTNFYGKIIERTHALKDISFSIKKGEIFGILGPNGAGKSTLIKIMATLLKEDSGSIKILGLDVDKNEKVIRQKINLITGSERGLYWRLTARENLEYFAELYGISKKNKKNLIDKLVKLVGLFGREDEKVEKYSKGMKQRLQIARGLINDPQIIFLDEPTLGLDVLSAVNLRKLIKELSREGKTIIYTTHYMKEAEEICDRVLFINKGKVLDIGNIDDLKRKNLKNKKMIIYWKNIESQINAEIKNVEIISNTIKKTEFIFNTENFKIEDFIKKVNFKNVEALEIVNFSLEELYINIMENTNE
ncbi:ABC transporter ATP-binding protein [Fusobacterium polymorphum]|uniref:ABC transporter ATP-binding protein n=1 Tax=Fusobacterium nucleatum subsp. polymorphum TaxID=76857 RepID=UPI0022E7CBA1|nr:ABC transporter ATP-binding protein [Fusobacterium polymorphum]